VVNDEYKPFSNGIQAIDTSNFNSFSVRFKVFDEQRSLLVTHTSSNDYAEIYKGDKVIFSLGNWGCSTQILHIVAEVLKPFGTVYMSKEGNEDKFIRLEP